MSSAIGIQAYISGKSLVPMVQLLHKATYSMTLVIKVGVVTIANHVEYDNCKYFFNEVLIRRAFSEIQ